MKIAWVVGAVVSAASVLWWTGVVRANASGAAMFDVGSPPPPPPKGWSDEDFRALAEVAKRAKMNPADLLLVYESESALKPDAANRDSSGFPIAVGIGQWTTASNPATGLSEAERKALLTKPVSAQIAVADRFWQALTWTKMGRKYDHAGVAYGANFAPGRMVARGTGLDVVLYDTADGLAYERNKGLDRGGKGAITMRDLVERLREVAHRPAYKGALAAMRKALGDDKLSPGLPR